ncbi:MAG: hypothetical protein M3P06_03100 [Acidobacteriota bacterium]|nr:hypothetical protein [Acidobacteriota bacterium]
MTDILHGRRPKPEDEEAVQRAAARDAQALAFLNDVLRQFVTLDATLLAGSLFLSTGAPFTPGAAKVITVLLFLALLTAFIGIVPYEGRYAPDDPAAIRAFEAKVVRAKRVCIWVAAIATTLAFAVALGSFLAGAP